MNKGLILAALLSVGVLVGCGNTSSSETPSSEAPSSSEVSSEASSEEISSESSSEEVSIYGTFENPISPADVAEICKDFENNAPSAEKGYVTGVIKDEPSENTKYSSWSFYLEAGNIQFQVYSAILSSKLTTTPKKGDTVIVYGYFTKFYEKYEVAYISSLNDSPEIQSIVPGEGNNNSGDTGDTGNTGNTSSSAVITETTNDGTKVSTVIEAYADEKGWTNGNPYLSFTLNNVVTVTSTGTPIGTYPLNTGKYYTNGENWRLYQNEGSTLTISVANNYELVSVKITYSVKNTGTLSLNNSNVSSGTAVEASGSSITFSVGNTNSSVTNGQAQITAIEVVYKAA